MDLEGHYAKWNETDIKNTGWYYKASKKYNKVMNIRKMKQSHRYRVLLVNSGERKGKGSIKVGG